MYKRVQELEAKLHSVSSKSERIEILQLLVFEYYCNGLIEPDHLIEQTRTLLDQSPENPKAEINQLTLLAFQAYFKGDVVPALEKINSAILYYQEHSYDAWLWRAQTLAVMIYVNSGQYALALETAQHADEISQRLSDPYAVALTTALFGLIHLRTENYQRALEYYQQSLAQATRYGDTHVQILSWFQSASIYLTQQQHDKALTFAQHALHAVNESKNTIMLVVVLGVLTDIHIQMGNYDEALHIVSQGLEITASGRWLEYLNLSLKLGKIYNLLQQHDMALKILTEMLQLAQEKAALRFIPMCHQELANTYKNLSQLEAALYHYEQLFETQNKLFSVESDQRLRTLEVIHRTQQATAEAEQERQLRALDREHFQQLSKIKDDLIEAVSHDLKSPLSSMDVLLHLLTKHIGDDQKALEYVERLRLSMTNMRTLITDLLDLASLETGHALRLEPIPITAFVQNIVQQHEILALDKNVRLSFVSALLDVEVMFDPAKIRRVIDNLISNAIKFTPRGGAIAIEVEQIEDEIVIRVEDTGPGIPATDLPHIFERFYRVKDGYHAEQEGTGLGLSIVKSIVEKHGGKIWVNSELDRGSVFSFSLPLGVAQAV